MSVFFACPSFYGKADGQKSLLARHQDEEGSVVPWFFSRSIKLKHLYQDFVQNLTFIHPCHNQLLIPSLLNRLYNAKNLKSCQIIKSCQIPLSSWRTGLHHWLIPLLSISDQSEACISQWYEAIHSYHSMARYVFLECTRGIS